MSNGLPVATVTLLPASARIKAPETQVVGRPTFAAQIAGNPDNSGCSFPLPASGKLRIAVNSGRSLMAPAEQR